MNLTSKQRALVAEGKPIPVEEVITHLHKIALIMACSGCFTMLMQAIKYLTRGNQAEAVANEAMRVGLEECEMLRAEVAAAEAAFWKHDAAIQEFTEYVRALRRRMPGDAAPPMPDAVSSSVKFHETLDEIIRRSPP